MAAVKADGTQEMNAVYYSRSPFGSQEAGSASGSGSVNPGTGFTGAAAPNAGAGFVYLRNRWYDPKTGRFLTHDPIGLAGGVNLYSYAGNNPIAYSDPFGDSTFVNCRAVKNDNGSSKTWAHCALRVRNGKIDATIQAQPSSRRWMGFWPTMAPRTSGPSEPLTRAYTQPWIAVSVPEGQTVDQFDKGVQVAAHSFGRIANGLPYLPLGKFNSNAFVYDVITAAGGRVPIAVSTNIGKLVAPGICGGSFLSEGSDCSP